MPERSPDIASHRKKGNVGIGTTNPTAKLHVSGVSGTDGIRYPDGTLQTTAAGINLEMLLKPSAAKFPASNSMVLDRGLTVDALLADAATDESIHWTNLVAHDYQGGTLKADIAYSMASATSNNVTFTVSVWAISDGDAVDVDTESYDAANAATVAVPGTAGYLDVATITLSNKDGLANGDLLAIKLTRDADNASDTATGDAEVRWVRIYEE